MRTSDNIDKISAALAEALNALPTAEKDAVNPHLKSKYASLQSCMRSWHQVSRIHGLCLIQTTARTPAGLVLTTRVIHTSGQWIEGDTPIDIGQAKNPMQALGSAITYARRYGLSIIGIVTGEGEDDGEGIKVTPTAKQETLSMLSEAAAKGREAFGKAWKRVPPAERSAIDKVLMDEFKRLCEAAEPKTEVNDVETITDKQKRLLEARIKEAGIDREKFKELVYETCGAETFMDILRVDFGDILNLTNPQ